MLELIKDKVRDIPDFPKEGILYKDITPLFESPETLTGMLNILFERFKNKGITKIVGLESRGFLLGPALANSLNCGFVPIRKKGKLPYKTYSTSYDLEYGSAEIEIHQDSLNSNDIVLIHDDLLATGGTAEAAMNLINQTGAKIFGFSFIIYLEFLKGESKLNNYKIDYLIKY